MFKISNIKMFRREFFTMKNFKKSAKAIDKGFNCFQIILKIGFVASVVGLAILLLGMAFDLPKYLVGDNWNSLRIGDLTFHLSDKAIPDKNNLYLSSLVQIFSAAVLILFTIRAVKHIRAILSCVIDGAPFKTTVSDNLKSLAVLVFIIGSLWNIAEIANKIVITNTYKLNELLLNDNINSVMNNYVVDLGFVITGLLLLLVAAVFRYGEELQNQYDETL